MDHVDHETLAKLALRVEEDLHHACGWEQPPRLYALWGTVDDPNLRLVCELASDSPAMLKPVAGERLQGRGKPFGLVLVLEGYCYPKDLHEQAWVPGAVEALWGFLPPVWHPRRVWERGLTLVMHDGTACTVRRQVGGEPEALRGYDLTRDGCAVDAMRELVAA
ncbi:MAG TPA: hypothetical protein VG452_04445 [Egibacteraceae bacterium]|nr:hypothetical protein [Actinomycetota bacterium]HWB71446.1 hypothetical protein [Egibacteraceae bacterium]